MNLKKMIAVCAALAVTVVTASARDKKQPTGMEDRQVWVNTLVKIADPVLSNLANNTLRENMPQESLDTKRVHRFSHLEAVGRTLCGIAPWLELGADETEEGKLRIGFAGSQINMSETYINTGSVYLCTFGFLALGLPATDPFWTEPFTPWTGLKAWNGEDVVADHAIGD